jgi:hypothetical protein|tara:strand:- start:1648 stop:1845 length:198 start_codon:yes stop_codon:yes gene_type:complete
MKNLLIITTILFALISCKKDKCQTCTKTIGGVAGNVVDEVREVCDEDEISNLEASSAGTTVWKCE